MERNEKGDMAISHIQLTHTPTHTRPLAPAVRIHRVPSGRLWCLGGFSSRLRGCRWGSSPIDKVEKNRMTETICGLYTETVNSVNCNLCGIFKILIDCRYFHDICRLYYYIFIIILLYSKRFHILLTIFLSLLHFSLPNFALTFADIKDLLHKTKEYISMYILYDISLSFS